MRLIFLALSIGLILTAVANAEGSSMKVLAVSEKDGVFEGITADLFLEIRPGSGKVFIESFPLSKIDTQISTRFAAEIACNDLDIDCEKYDFFYTIKAGTSIIEGPSAGAAAAVLTASTLEGLELRKDTSITGTINSGGLIGPVGGVKEKISAASKAGIKKVLIPVGTRFITNSSNDTVDLVKFGKSVGVNVIEVSDLRESLYQFTGSRLEEPKENFSVDKSYSSTMSFLAESLCNKSLEFSRQNMNRSDEYYSAINLTNKGMESMARKEYYSSASYCFGADVKYRYLNLSSSELTKDQLLAHIEAIKISADTLEKSIPELKTITDLQSFTSMKERILEAHDNLNLSRSYIEANKTNEALYPLAYAEERVFSANAWASFLGKPGKNFVFDKQSLQMSCERKISEAEERFEYTKLFLENGLPNIRQDIGRAYEDLNNGHYELCLAKAAKAKSGSDVILSAISVDKAHFSELIDRKLEAARRTISRSAEKGIFPIVGYSYFEYARSLKDSDPYSALLYTEYAIELSNMDIYFKKTGVVAPPETKHSEYNVLGAFIAGLGLGGLIMLGFLSFKRKKVVKKAVIRRY